jgi:hypothetical protein
MLTAGYGSRIANCGLVNSSSDVAPGADDQAGVGEAEQLRSLVGLNSLGIPLRTSVAR